MTRHGIMHEISCVNTPSLNGVDEQKNRYLLEIIKPLLFHMHMPNSFWVNLVSTMCFLINLMLFDVLLGDIPYHTLFTTKHLYPVPLWIFGCIGFLRNVSPQVSMLDLSLKFVFLGYSWA